MNAQLRLSVIWDQAVASLRRDGQIMAPVAAAFLFLPSVLLSYCMPAPSLGAIQLSILLPMFMVLMLQTVGQLAILSLMLDRDRPVVADALRRSVRRLGLAIGVQMAIVAILCALLVVAQILVLALGLATPMGSGGQAGEGLKRMALLGLAIAGPASLYILSRFAVAFPALVAEGLTPFEALRRSYKLTLGNGWRIAGLILVVGVLYLFVLMAFTAAFGAVFLLFERVTGLQGIGNLMVILLSGVLGTAANLILISGVACLYRDLRR